MRKPAGRGTASPVEPYNYIEISKEVTMLPDATMWVLFVLSICCFGALIVLNR